MAEIISATIVIKDDSNGTTRVKLISGLKGESILNNLKAVLDAWLLNNYELVSDFPSSIEADDKITIHVKHKVSEFSHEKVVTRTIEYVTNDDSTAPNKVTQSLHFKQIGAKDLVTGSISYQKAEQNKTFKAVKSPEVKGYTVDLDEVGEYTLTIDQNNFNDDLNQVIIVNYLANKETIKVKYYDQTDKKLIKTDKITGFVNKDANYEIEIEPEYTEVSNNLPAKLKFTADKNTYQVNLQHKVVPVIKGETPEAILEKEITRTISLVAGDHELDKIVQKATFTRTGVIDLVTKKITYRPYQDSFLLKAVDIPKIAGYTRSQKQIPDIKIQSTSENIEETVNYLPNDLVITVNFVDLVEDEVIATKTFKGKTDEVKALDLTDEISDLLTKFYILEDNPIKGNVTFKPNKLNYEITFKHNIQKLTLHNPINSLSGADLTKELEKTVTRTIVFNISNEDKRPGPVVQSAIFTRDAELDLVTKKLSYSAWSDDVDFTGFEVPEIAGYKPNKNQIDDLTVSGTDDNTREMVSYQPKDVSLSFSFKDLDLDTVLALEKFTGKVDQEIDFDLENVINVIKESGYDLVNNPFNLEVFPSSGKEYEITVKHQVKEYDDTKLAPKDYKMDKDYKFTVSFVDKDNNDLLNPYVLTQKLHRKAFKDLVTSEVTYGNWEKVNDLPESMELAPIKNLMPLHRLIEVPNLAKLKRDEYTVALYLASQQEVIINFITDRDEKIANYIIDFKLHDHKKIKTKQLINKVRSKGYELTADSEGLPNVIAYDKTLPDSRTYTLKVKEILDSTIETQEITRTISITNPDQSRRIIKQTAILTRVCEEGKVSKRKVHHKWSVNIWDAYNPSKISGYILSTKQIPECIVDENTEDQLISVSYVKLSQSMQEKQGQMENSVPKRDQKPKQVESPVISLIKKFFGISDASESNDQLQLEAPKDK